MERVGAEERGNGGTSPMGGGEEAGAMTECVFCRIASGNERPVGELWYRSNEVTIFTNTVGDIVAVEYSADANQ